jgi:anti-sigma factor RsiW
LERPLDRHIDSAELNALVPGAEGAAREAELHVASCAKCAAKVAKYRRVVEELSNARVSGGTARGAGCPKDVDWPEVAAGQWPELKATQLMMHAALCDHCGPLLRAAASLTTAGDDATPQEEKLLAELKAPARPEVIPVPEVEARRGWGVRWLVPALAALAIAGGLAVRPRASSSLTPTAGLTLMSSAEFGELAVRSHRAHAEGSLPLDVRSESQQTVNGWFQEKLPFALALPASLEQAGEERPNRLEGARLVRAGGKAAAYIAYQMQAGSASLPVSLMVTPNSVAVASGGVEVNFKKVTFHYGMVEGYRVVTWSLHGLTYALVSQEGNTTQRACMVCHSAMRDRDLSQTPPPLLAQRNALTPAM